MTSPSPNAGFRDLSADLDKIQGLSPSIKELLPKLVSEDPTYELQQIRLNSFDIYGYDDYTTIISQNIITNDCARSIFISLGGFPNTQELYRKGRILEDLKMNPMLEFEDVKKITEIIYTISKPIEFIAKQISEMKVYKENGEFVELITIANINKENVIPDIEMNEELNAAIKEIDILKQKYIDTTLWVSFSAIQNLPTTAGGIKVNPSRGAAISLNDYVTSGGSVDVSVKFGKFIEPGSLEKSIDDTIKGFSK